MNKKELEKQCKHIISYGPEGWGLGFLRRSIKDELLFVKENKRAIKESILKIKAYKEAIKIAEKNK